MKPQETFYDLLSTSLGWIGVLASPRGLRQVTLPHATPDEALRELAPIPSGHRAGAFDDLCQRLERHFQGEEVPLDDPLDLEEAPPFFRAAWEACRTIPAGETRSYAWLAAMAGRPGAARAAGQSMAKNPIAILIPCHRVISSDGGLHGYGGGLELKASLLRAEGWQERLQGIDLQ